MSLRRLSTGSGYQSTGARNQQIQIMQPSTRRDGTGEFLDDQVFAECWARVQDISHKYTEKPQVVVTEATDVVYIPFIPGITKAMKVKAGTRTMNIETVVDPDNMQVELKLYCYDRGI
jgi:SPP1 family predicted phage head-tail adaptor